MNSMKWVNILKLLTNAPSHNVKTSGKKFTDLSLYPNRTNGEWGLFRFCVVLLTNQPIHKLTHQPTHWERKSVIYSAFSSGSVRLLRACSCFTLNTGPTTSMNLRRFSITTITVYCVDFISIRAHIHNWTIKLGRKQVFLPQRQCFQSINSS